MNVTTRTLAAQQIFSRSDVLTNVRGEALVLPAPKFYALLLILVVLFSSLSLVYVKDLNRRLFVNYQAAQNNYVKLQVEEGKLLLEQSLLVPHTKIQAIAEQNFNMEIPIAKNVVVMKV